MKFSNLVVDVNNSHALLAAHAASVLFGAVVIVLVLLGGWALVRGNWRAGVLLGACGFLWGQLLFALSAGFAALAAAAHLHLIGMHVSEHLDVVLRVAKDTTLGQQLALVGLPAGLLVAVVGWVRSSAAYNAAAPCDDEPLAG
jgi:hypothetical protein